MVSAKKRATTAIGRLLGGGIGLSLLGMIIALAQQPEQGVDGGYRFGLFLATVGGCMLWIIRRDRRDARNTPCPRLIDLAPRDCDRDARAFVDEVSRRRPVSS